MGNKTMDENTFIKKMIREGYVSDLDQFLKEFDLTHPDFCASRITEIEKFKKIAAKRDGVVKEQPSKLWEKF
jgi:hypothetical protein